MGEKTECCAYTTQNMTMPPAPYSFHVKKEPMDIWESSPGRLKHYSIAKSELDEHAGSQNIAHVLLVLAEEEADNALAHTHTHTHTHTSRQHERKKTGQRNRDIPDDGIASLRTMIL